MDENGIDAVLADAAGQNRSALTEAGAKQVFRAAGMTVVQEMVVNTAQQAMDAACELGFPVVLKAMGEKILHKTEAGLVHTGLATAEQVNTAVQQMTVRAGKDLEGFLVQPMVQGKRELVAGLRHISVCIAGTTSTGQVAISMVAPRRSSASPWAAFARKFAVAGATTTRSAHCPSPTCSVGSSQTVVWTGRPLRACHVASPTMRRALAVGTTWTSCPSPV
ncbi:MAG: acetate--CoA ligase family protein, partial [Desulfotignum sp.]